MSLVPAAYSTLGPVPGNHPRYIPDLFLPCPCSLATTLFLSICPKSGSLTNSKPSWNSLSLRKRSWIQPDFIHTIIKCAEHVGAKALLEICNQYVRINREIVDQLGIAVPSWVWYPVRPQIPLFWSTVNAHGHRKPETDSFGIFDGTFGFVITETCEYCFFILYTGCLTFSILCVSPTCVSSV